MLLGFKKQFVQPILIGTKVHTMRKRRKVQPKIGETLYMYTGLRTANCEKISDKEKLMSIQSVLICIKNKTGDIGTADILINIDGKELELHECRNLAIYDGFKSLAEFMHYWLEGKKEVSALVQLFHWTDLKY